jgi:hypothetical protein
MQDPFAHTFRVEQLRGCRPETRLLSRGKRGREDGQGHRDRLWRLPALRERKSSGYLAEVVELLTMALGSELAPGRGTDRPRRRARGVGVEQLSDEIEDRLREAVPDVTEVFLDATTSPAGRRPAGPAGTRPWTT